MFIHTALIATALLLVMSRTGSAQDQAELLGEVREAYGDASICRGSGSSLEVCTPMKKGDKIYRGDRLTTEGSKSRARIWLKDEDKDPAKSGPSIIYMGHNTETTLDRWADEAEKRSNRKPGMFEQIRKSSDSLFEVIKGRMQIYLKEDVLPSGRINVRTGTTVCGVSGGTDNVSEYDPGTNTSVFALRTGFAVCKADNGEERRIDEMQVATVANGQFGSVFSIDQAQWDQKVIAVQAGLGGSDFFSSIAAADTVEEPSPSNAAQSVGDAKIDLLKNPWYKRMRAYRGMTVGDLTQRDVGPPNIEEEEEVPEYYILVVEMSGAGYNYDPTNVQVSAGQVRVYPVSGRERYSMVVRRDQDPHQMLRRRREELRQMPECIERGVGSGSDNTPPQLWDSGPQFKILKAGPYVGLGQLDDAIQDGLTPPLQRSWEVNWDGEAIWENFACGE